MLSKARTVLGAAFASGILTMPQAAVADTLVMTGFAHPPALTLRLNSPSMEVYAGGFNATYTPTAGAPRSFIAYCIDLFQTFSFGSPFSVSPIAVGTHFGSAIAGNLDRLYTQHFSSVDTPVESAAFQLAIWEITRETGGVYSLTSGSFTADATPATNPSDLAAISLANTWLGSLASGPAGGFVLTALVSPNRQDQLMATPIPEPATYLMLLAGLGMMGFVVRNRRMAF